MINNLNCLTEQFFSKIVFSCQNLLSTSINLCYSRKWVLNAQGALTITRTYCVLNRRADFGASNLRKIEKITGWQMQTDIKWLEL